jgi:DNA-binding transcriptional LysR family regulator
MDRLKAMKVFVKVSEQGGFTAAARDLDLSTSATSRYIAGFEDWLGTPLFHRTTRQLSLTALST